MHKKRGTMNKKAQITLFIIIGLVLLLTFGLVIYVTTKKVTQPVEELIVPDDVRSIYDYIATCLSETSREALGILGQQGGYIYIPDSIAKTPTSYIPLDSFNFFKLPYWYYEGEDRTPSVNRMQSEVSKYIKENFGKCIDFSSLEEMYSISERNNAEIETLFTEQEVIVKLEWPLEVETSEKTTTISEFLVRHPVKVKKMWELASAVMEYENQYKFFENMTIALMAADEEVPMDGLTFRCGVERWHLRDITDRVKRVLYYNLPFVRVENTKFIPFIEKRRVYEKLAEEREEIVEDLKAGRAFKEPKYTPTDAYQFFNLKFDIGIAATDLKASFQYLPEWGMALSAQPNDGGVLKSNMVKGASKFMSFLCINQWHFTYDVIYPIKMIIRDDSAFKDEGYIFQFAFPVLINDNEGERIYFGLRRFEGVEFDTGFCENLGMQVVDIRIKGFEEEGLFATELPDVNVTYKCFNQECYLGKTRADEGYYRLRTLMPKGCVNPFIIASKEGYLPKTEQITGDRLDILLTGLKRMKYRVVIHPYFSTSLQFLPQEEFKENREASIRLTLKDGDYDQFKSYPSNDTIEFVDGTAKYDLDINLALNGNMIGGYKAEDLEIAYEDLVDKEEVIFHIVEYRPTPKNDQEAGAMAIFLFGESYQDTLKPEFK